MSLYELGDDLADPANLPETVTLDARHQAFLEYEAPAGGDMPEKVQQVIKGLHDVFEAQKNLGEIHTMYEVTVKTLSEVYYKSRQWPTETEIQELQLASSSLFLVLYKEMYYRHAHAIGGASVSLEDRVGSFQNYYNLFSYIARVDPTELKFDLPNQWIWDLIDEYIYQFNDFARYRARMAKQNDEQATFLREHGEIWNSATVIDLLNQLMKRSDIAQILEAPLKASGATIVPTSDIVEKNSSHLLRMLGYYSLVGLLRVHTLLGDYHSALRSVDIIDFGAARREKIYAKVVMCQVSLFFHTGFALLMVRRYADCAKFLTQLLSYIARVRGVHLRGYQVDDISKKNDQVYQLLAVAHSLCPVRLEEGTVQMLKDKLGDKLNKLAQGDLETYGEVFRFAAPKFIPATINVDGDVGVFDATDLQKKRFLHEVRQQVVLPTIRSYLSLYSSITVSKLATFMTDKENNPLPPEQFRTFLLQLKHKSRQLVWQGGRITEGERMFCGSIDFYIQKDMVFVTNNAASKQRSSCAQFFFEQIQRLNCLDDLRFLPAQRPAGSAGGDERGQGRGRGRGGRGRGGGDRGDRGDRGERGGDRQY